MGLGLRRPLWAAMKQATWDSATAILKQATESGQVHAASLYVRHHGKTEISEGFGAAKSADAIFLLASISKPISAAAVMALRDQGFFGLHDRVSKYLPEFTGEGREQITLKELLTHVSGLPDQLPENEQLRSRHAKLDEFVERAIVTPLLFSPGSRYSYSSMGILLASEIARRTSGKAFSSLVEETVLQPLRMTRSAMGTGELPREALITCQVENAAPEAGSGNVETTDWDWNSDYWRQLAAPWGGAHGSAIDVGKFLAAFLNPQAGWLSESTLREMTGNANPEGIWPRGLGFDLGRELTGGTTSERAFGHGGATGTLAWADPQTDTLCVVLTTLPARAVKAHPRMLTSAAVADMVASPERQ